MSNKILTALTGQATPHAADSLYIVDSTDTTDGTNGTSKKIAFSALTSTLATSGANSNITSLSGLTTPLTVAQGGTGVTVSTGTVAVVRSTSPTLVTPILGTPISVTLTNATGLPIATGVSGLGTGVATFLATPSSANLATAVTGETGTGALVFGTAPTISSPIIQQDWNMWITATDTWTYASATTFTIAGVDRTAIFTKGTRLKFTNNAITVYATVIASAFSTNTTVTVATNTDYTIANSAITLPFYSYAANPAGWPTWFTFTHNATWNGTPPTTPTTVAQFSTIGQMCYYRFYQTNTGAGTNNNTITINQPIASSISASIYHDGGVGYYSSNDNTGLPNQAPAMFYCILFSNTLIYGSCTNIAAKAAWLQGFYSF